MITTGLFNIRTNQGWWRDNAAGYTTSQREAGRFTREEAEAHVRGLGAEKRARIEPAPFETLEAYYTANPCDEPQMHRWLGCMDGLAGAMIRTGTFAGHLRQDLERIPVHHRQRRKALKAKIDIYESLHAYFKEQHGKVQSVYRASADGAAQRKLSMTEEV